MEWVADHLGHTLDVERTYYRVMSSTLEKAKIAKLLILSDKGRLDEYHGKTLNELQFDGKIHKILHSFGIDCNNSGLLVGHSMVFANRDIQLGKA